MREGRRERAHQFYEQELRFEGFEPVSDLGDEAAFRARVGELVVRDGLNVYKVQVLSEKVASEEALEPAKEIFSLLSG